MREEEGKVSSRQEQGKGKLVRREGGRRDYVCRGETETERLTEEGQKRDLHVK